MARQELARFLRDRRDGLRPHEVGLPTDAPRRTPGLRREEVAELAHMSVDYYVRLEQARGPRPSPRILDGLARALRLTPAERSHLFRLAGTSAPPGADAVRRVRPHVAGMLERLPETGAIVTDAAYGIVAWNPLAQVLLGGDLGHGTTNLARRRFLGQGRMYESSSAEEFGHIVVARLRRSADRYPHDAGLAALLADLRSGSEEFRQLWETRPVHAPGHRVKTLDHPAAGKLRLNCDVLLVPEDDQEVVLITADPGSPSARTLGRLAAQAGTGAGRQPAG
jgi:transcriptional regulator with XRE-family HTH domain